VAFDPLALMPLALLPPIIPPLGILVMRLLGPWPGGAKLVPKNILDVRDASLRKQYFQLDKWPQDPWLWQLIFLVHQLVEGLMAPAHDHEEQIPT
jgi:hypothetical protein